MKAESAPQTRSFPILSGVLIAGWSSLAFSNDGAVSEVLPTEDQNIEIQWEDAGDDFGYTIETSTRLQPDSWVEAEGEWPIVESRWKSAIQLSDGGRFFRLITRLLNPPYLASEELDDEDEDGLSRFREWQLGTDPLKADTDGDGLLDGYEEFLAHHPDYAELSLDPLDPDSDGDMISDFLAVVLFFDFGVLPGEPGTDSDGDGLTDRLESFLDLDPENPDTDGDGLSDKDERELGTNPKAAIDAGDPGFYLPFAIPEQYHYLTDPDLVGIEYDTFFEVFGYEEPVPPGSESSGNVSALVDPSATAPPGGNTPIGTGDGDRPIYYAHVVETKDGRKAVRVPTQVCATGFMLVKEGQTIREEVVTRFGTEESFTMWTVIPFDEMDPQVFQNCCVQQDLIDPATDPLQAQLAELFGDELEVLRTVTNYVLSHGLMVFDLKDAERFYATRDKFIRCCGFSKSKATAISIAIMVFVNLDAIGLEILLGALPFNIGDVISLVDREFLGQKVNNYADGLIDDEEVTKSICDVILWNVCRKFLKENTAFGCPTFDDTDLLEAATEGRSGDSGEGRPGEEGDGNPDNENVGRSVPVDYGRGDPPEENPDGNKPPPGGAGAAQNGEKVGDGPPAIGDGNRNGGIGNKPGGDNGGNDGDGKDGRPAGGPKGGTPGGPLPVPELPPDDPPPEGWVFEFGDAPDEDLSASYPAPNDDVVGRFPTVFNTNNSRYDLPGGHILYPGYLWLGRRYSMEIDAISGDTDDETNLDLALQLSNRDYYDDGLVLPFSTNPCGLTQLSVAIGSWAGIEVGYVYVNVLVDFDRDGDWSGETDGAAEWAVKNYRIPLLRGEEQIVALPPFQTPCEPFPAWTRILLSDIPVTLSFFSTSEGWDGSGYYNFGEVEDYFIE